MVGLLQELGATIVGISDSKGAVYAAAGIDVAAISALKSARKSVIEYPDATQLDNLSLLEQEADILIPAALENQITKSNASAIQAKYILELANGPTTPDADAILESRGVIVIPDILANAGGVTVSYFEQVQNNANFYWSEEEVDEKLHKILSTSALSVYNEAKSRGTTLRNGAYIIAMKRIIAAMRASGQI